MARFYLLQLETIYFTSDGLAGGIPCRLELSGLDGLASDVSVSSVDQQNDGSVKLQTVTNAKKGVHLQVNLLGSLKDTTFNALDALIAAAIEAGSTLTLVGTGKPYNFSLEVVALAPTTKGFSNNRIKGASFEFITT